jgi:uncharacterized protein (TIGR02001 family)
VFRIVVAVLLASFVMQARAQMTGSAALVSDYRFRGVSLSNDLPSAQLALGYDWAKTGWYTGGMMANVRLDTQSAAQLLLYGGYAHRISADFSVEAGVRYTRFTGQESYAYAETYAGFAYKRLVGRVYYSPNYFNNGYPTWYAELSDSHALTGHWYVFAHAGYLRLDGNVMDDHVSRFRSDFQAGMGLSLLPCNVQLSWNTSHGAPNAVIGYPSAAGATRNAWVLSISYAW